VTLAVATRAAVVLRAAATAFIVSIAWAATVGSVAAAQAPARRPDSAALRSAPRDTALEELTRRVSAQLRCPVCQGLSLADSPSELAREMKDVVRDQLAAGRTPDEVKAYFVAKYGEWILLEPPRRGVNLLAYVLPGAAAVAGLAVIWLLLGRWTKGAPPTEEVPEAEAID
jgi:cytochrome c-type biogenesis protein CcmH/NrfF